MRNFLLFSCSLKLVRIEKTRLSLDYYCKIYLDGSICLHAGYGKMVVRKTKGAQSCEVENEKRGGAIYVPIHALLSSNYNPSTTAVTKGLWMD